MLLPEEIELTHQFEQTFELLEETDNNVFVTGKAGTGKSTLLHYFKEKTEKEIAVLAPTGVAALNVQGQTIHSFFDFGSNITLQKVDQVDESDKKLYENLDAIVIDEISMLRADLLDCIDKFLRINVKDKPFGGIQMIFFGDLYQLPPVVTRDERSIFKSHYDSPYFFSSKSLKEDGFKMKLVRLDKIYRQKNKEFINILSRIRNNSLNKKDLNILNKKFDSEFQPNSEDFYITLTTTNKLAYEVNSKRLEKLDNEPHSYRGKRDGDFEDNYLPTKKDLTIKKRAQIMLLNNDKDGRWVNGSIGKVLEILSGDTFEDTLIVELKDGDVVRVEPHTWKIHNYFFDENNKEVKTEEVGSFKQYPVRLAWAVTIHKSQGKTFEKVIINFGNGAFAHGQAYVALSRCESLEDIVLKTKIRRRDIITDRRINIFFSKLKTKKSS